MRILLVLFPFLARFTDTCAPTRAATPIVCPCATDEVALLDRIDGSGDPANYIQPVGTVADADSNMCPLVYTVECTPPSAGTVTMSFQDQISGLIEAQSLNLTCTDGNWLYTDPNAGQTLVVSVACQFAPA
uniref:C6 domain-containing protein n=1 Tax=Caenorhabditis tropicalis TaxID=1561998 RepID=A0A1I7UXF9_9PELO